MLKWHPPLKQWVLPLPRISHTRLSSTTSINFPKLEVDLKARTFPILYDYLTPPPSYLLDQSLKDFLALGTFPAYRPPPHVNANLPYGHHLAYFATPTTSSQLLPDGTDTLHSPGPPFTQRLWAGGRVKYPDRTPKRAWGRRARLLERIADVRVTGLEGSENLFVGIERRIEYFDMGEGEMRTETSWASNLLSGGLGFVEERRDLCFMRADDTRFARPSTPRKRLQPPTNPTFVFPLTPTPSLLFRFSALTFNAHAIHIDPEYTRNVYGLPNLLVHGPLCLALMLECLSRALVGTGAHGRIREFTYRNYRPLFVGEELRVCGKMKTMTEAQNSSTDAPAWDVWIETGQGADAALAVRGTASTTAPTPKSAADDERIRARRGAPKSWSIRRPVPDPTS